VSAAQSQLDFRRPTRVRWALQKCCGCVSVKKEISFFHLKEIYKTYICIRYYFDVFELQRFKGNIKLLGVIVHKL